MPRFYSLHSALALSLDRVSGAIGKSVAWLTAAMALTVAAVVLLRAVAGVGAIAAQEAVTYMHALVIMLAGAYTLRDDGQVRVDIFYHRFTPVQKAWVNALGSLLLLAPLALTLVISSWGYVAASWAIRETSADAGGLPAVFLLKSLIVANGLLLFAQALAETARALLTMTYTDD